MTAKNGIHVGRVKRTGAKTWVKVWTVGEGGRIAFEDLFDIVQKIVQCEVEKYESNGRSPEEAWERWAKMPRQVLERATTYGVEWDAVADEFDLPRRDGTRAPPPVVVFPSKDEKNGHDDLGWHDGKEWE